MRGRESEIQILNLRKHKWGEVPRGEGSSKARPRSWKVKPREADHVAAQGRTDGGRLVQVILMIASTD